MRVTEPDKFRTRPCEVEAMFLGQGDAWYEVYEWLERSGVRARMEIHAGCPEADRITIENDTGYSVEATGLEWIVRHSDGSFTVEPEHTFWERYEEALDAGN